LLKNRSFTTFRMTMFLGRITDSGHLTTKTRTSRGWGTQTCSELDLVAGVGVELDLVIGVVDYQASVAKEEAVGVDLGA